MNKKKNKHYLRTHKAIEDCLLSLLKNKSLNQITAAEICRSLSINRSTFYAHFIDIADVLDQTEWEYQLELKAAFEKGLFHSRRDAFISLFRFIAEHKDFYILYVTERGEISLSDLMTFNIPDALHMLHSDSSSIQEEDILYFMDFFRSGTNAMIRRWLFNDCDKSAEDLFLLLRKQMDIFSSTLKAMPN